MEWLGIEELRMPECLSAFYPDDSYGLQLPEHSGTRLLAAMFLSSALYLLYYLTFVVNKPRLFGGGVKLKPHLLEHCPTLEQHYWPTIWAINCHVSTLSRFILQKDIDIEYYRTILKMPDGGEVGLDWGQRSRDKKEGGRLYMCADAPILLLLAGLTGSSDDTYIKYVMEDGLCCGYRPVVFVQRGTGGLLLKTPRMYCATKIDDLQHVLNYLNCCFPHSDVVAMGISLGGMMVTQYLHQKGPLCDLKAALVISCPWNIQMSGDSMEGKFLNRHLYINYLTKSMKELIASNAAAIGEEALRKLPFDLDYVMESANISEVNERLICPLFGYRCLHDYHDAASNWNKMHRITTPLLCLSAADDPFVPGHSLPLKGFSSNPHTLLATTSRGGHFGFVEGLLPTSQTWMNRVCREFLTAIRDYKH